MNKARFLFTMIGLSAWTLGAGNAVQIDQGVTQAASEKRETVVDSSSHKQSRTRSVHGEKFSVGAVSISKVVTGNFVNGHGPAPAKLIGFGAKRESFPGKFDTSPLQFNQPTVASIGGPSFTTRNRGPNPAIIGGPARAMIKNNAVINGTGMKRKP